MLYMQTDIGLEGSGAKVTFLSTFCLHSVRQKPTPIVRANNEMVQGITRPEKLLRRVILLLQIAQEPNRHSER